MIMISQQEPSLKKKASFAELYSGVLEDESFSCNSAATKVTDQAFRGGMVNQLMSGVPPRRTLKRTLPFSHHTSSQFCKARK